MDCWLVFVAVVLVLGIVPAVGIGPVLFLCMQGSIVVMLLWWNLAIVVFHCVEALGFLPLASLRVL